MIYYPVPPHKQQAYIEIEYLSKPISERIHREVLSLPVSHVIPQTELVYIIEMINLFNNNLIVQQGIE